MFDYSKLSEELESLKSKTNNPKIWENPKAKIFFQEIKLLETRISDFKRIKQSLKDLEEFYKLAIDEKDEETLNSLINDSKKILNDSNNVRYLNLMNNEADPNSAFLEIHAGAGGTESQDWAMMLQRMYLRWAEKNNFKFKLIHEAIGDEAGIKSCTALIEGNYAFGYLKKESGIHRLVRISPFDSNSRRHTSFSSVWISPHVDDDIQIEILDKDLRIDTFRASGAGGQHVNTTDSAIRITHLPTNIVVQCQNERSQHKNKATAMNLLKSKLYELEIKKIEDERKASEDHKTEIGWGNQIRSYVLHPYRMVKDLRSNFEDPDPDAVLDGDIDKLIKSNFKK